MKEMKGLLKFIADIRECKSPEKEAIRINKELANIRKNFGSAKLSGYDRKKYVSKLVFIFLLGNDVEFGHLEALDLLSSEKFSEKQIGYLFVAVLLTDGHELVDTVSEAINRDLRSNKELEVCLALNCIANVGGKNMAGKVVPMVKQLLAAKEAPANVKKKAALALLRVVRYDPTIEMGDKFNAAVIEQLSSSDLGVVTAVSSLVISLALNNPDHYNKCVDVAVTRLHRLLMNETPAEYVYYQIPAPWLCIKLMRLLQIFPAPTGSTGERLKECVGKILARAEPSPEQTSGKRRPRRNHDNVNYGVFFEATNLIVHYDSSEEQQGQATTLMGNFLQEKQPNLKYLALEGLAALAHTKYSKDGVAQHLDTVLDALKHEADPTVLRRAVDVLYGVCDENNVEKIVKDLLLFLRKSDYSIREELVLKIAILSEKYASEYTWYVKVVLTLISLAGDHVTEEVWHRVLQIIVNQQPVQEFAARVCYQAMLDLSCHEAMVKVGAYVLGEFGHLIANDPACVPEKQLQLLNTHYPMVSVPTRCLLISTFVKSANLFPEMKEPVLKLLSQTSLTQSAHTEIQQRATEYASLLQLADGQVVVKVLDEMPPFADKSSSIEARLDKNKDITEQIGRNRRRPEAARPTSSASVALPSLGGGDAPAAASGGVSEVNNDAFFDKFWLADSGVLYENPVLQIGCKSEFTGTRGKVTLFYGNRGSDPFTDVTTRFLPPDVDGLVQLHADEVADNFQPGKQETQLLQINVVAPFAFVPKFEVKINFNGRIITITLKVPMTVNKFLAPLPNPLDATMFFEKWQQFAANETEVSFSPKADGGAMGAALTNFRFPPMLGIDPNAANYVGSAILHTSGAGLIGLLLRVEPFDSTTKVTVRASNDSAPAMVSAALQTAL